MTSSYAVPFVVNTRLLKTGAAIAGAGLVLATVGAGLAGLAVTRGARDWMQRHDVSPAALASEKARQIRHATVAGAAAWRGYPQAAANGVGR